MELDYKAIGKRIKIARIRADMTQERLAERTGISATHMSNIETGATHVSLTTLVNLANALSVTADCLLCDNVLQANAQFEGEMAALLAGCSPRELRMVTEMTQALLDALRRDARLQAGCSEPW